MCATDIPPNRLRPPRSRAVVRPAARSPARRSASSHSPAIAEVIQPPTTDQKRWKTAIESLTTGRGTAIGSGILESLDAIAEIDPERVAPSVDRRTQPRRADAGAEGRVCAGYHRPADRWREQCRPDRRWTPRSRRPIAASASTRSALAPRAARRCRTAILASPGGEPRSGGGGQFGGGGGGGFGGGGFRAGIDEDDAEAVAAMTDGEYYSAESASELTDVFQQSPDLPDHQARDDRDQRRVCRPRRAAGRDRRHAVAALASAAVVMGVAALTPAACGRRPSPDSRRGVLLLLGFELYGSLFALCRGLT